MIELLNSCLADIADLQTHAKHAHWNVKGPQFLSLHDLLQIASRLAQHADNVAEGITALGGVAHGTARQVAASSNLPQYDLDAVTGEKHVRAVAKRLALVGGRLRASVAVAHQLGDDATGDLLTEIVRQTDKDLWFLEAHVQAEVTGWIANQYPSCPGLPPVNHLLLRNALGVAPTGSSQASKTEESLGWTAPGRKRFRAVTRCLRFLTRICNAGEIKGAV